MKMIEVERRGRIETHILFKDQLGITGDIHVIGDLGTVKAVCTVMAPVTYYVSESSPDVL
jgi:hypothetical protein